MRNIEYHAYNIVWDFITKPKHKIYISHKPLADMVIKILTHMKLIK